MNIDSLLASSASVMHWLSLPEGKLFLDWLDATISEDEKTLLTVQEPFELYRAQGALKRMLRIAGLAEELRKYQKDKLAGKVEEVSKTRRL